MKKLSPFLMAVCITIICAGCWDYEEYEQMALVFAIGFDSGADNSIVITAEYTTSAKKGGGGGSSGNEAGSTDIGGSPIRQASSKNVAGSIDELQKVVDKQLFFGYTRAIVIGKEAAKKDMKRILKFLELTSYVRPSTNIIISNRTAFDVLSTVDMSDVAAASREIEDMLFNTGRTGTSFPVSLQDFFRSLERGGFEPVSPQIITQKAKADLEKKDGSGEVTLGSVEAEEGEHAIDGMAVFKKYKLEGWLDDRESLGLGWVLDKKPNIHINVYTGIQDENRSNEISFRVLDSTTKIDTILTGKLPEIHITTKVQVVLTEFSGSEQSVTLELIHEYEKKLAESIKSDIDAVNKKAKEFNSDIFGFGFKLFQQHTKEWQKVYSEKWDEIFPQLPVHVQVEADISSSGIKELPAREK